MTTPTPSRDRALPDGSEITGPMVRPAPAVGRAWRAKAHWVVRGLGPPTVPLALPGGDDDVSQRHARAVIDLALRIGEALLSTGASAADVVATVLRLTAAYGVRSAHVDITFTSISVSIQRGTDEDPLSVMRVIKVRSPDYTRLERILTLVDDIAAGAGTKGENHRPVETARAELEEILTAPHPFRRWVVTVGWVLIAVGVVVLFEGGPVMWVVAGLSAAVVDRVQRVLQTMGVAAFFSQAVSAAIPTLVAVVLFALANAGWAVPGIESPSLVVVSGIVVLLAGLGVMGAAQDAIDGYYVTAGARGLEVLMMTLGIAIGVATVLAVANRTGVPMPISPFLTLGGSPVVGTIGAMVVAVGFSLASYTGARATVVAALLGAVAWVVFEVVGLLALGQAATVTAAAAVVGVLGHAVQRQLRVPELAITTAAIVSLLPGLAVYRALFLMMEDSSQLVDAAVLEFLTALSVGLGLAAGLSIGSYAARRRFGLDRAAVRARRRSVGAVRS